jgi:antitoxin component YwqK of YwqJK toxin-antitoxin module
MERDGKREGPWRTYDENGVLQSEVYYESGLREGPFTQWFDDGKLMCRGTFSKDRETGSYESFHASGAPFSTGQMLRGKQHGLWVHQAEDGRVVSELTYVNGVLEGPCSYYTNGVLDTARSGIYSKGKKTGQ